MKSIVQVAAGFAAALALTASPPASAASTKLKLSVTPTSVAAGAPVTVKVSRSSAKRCTVSLREKKPGALVTFKQQVRRGRSSVTVPASAAAGTWVLGIRCGGKKATKRITVDAAVTLKENPDPITGPDDQGFVAGLAGSQDPELTESQLGGGDYPNAKIADIALSQLGRNLYTPGPLDHGQCKQAANDWVAAASGRTQVMGGDYYANYAKNGGTQVSRDDAAKGDIIQLDNPNDIRNYYRGMHTAVVLSHGVGSDGFEVVDSNFQLDTTVRRHTWDPYAAGRKYGLRVTIWRMGTVDTPPPVVTPPPATPTPVPAPSTRPETTGGAANTWTNPANAGGTQGPTIPARATVEIACKLQGFRVADGNTWWYRIQSSPWNGSFYVSADAFYNNGSTSGSLSGTPFFDPAVRDCLSAASRPRARSIRGAVRRSQRRAAPCREPPSRPRRS